MKRTKFRAVFFKHGWIIEYKSDTGWAAIKNVSSDSFSFFKSGGYAGELVRQLNKEQTVPDELWEKIGGKIKEGNEPAQDQVKE